MEQRKKSAHDETRRCLLSDVDNAELKSDVCQSRIHAGQLCFSKIQTAVILHCRHCTLRGWLRQGRVKELTAQWSSFQARSLKETEP